MWFHCCFEGMYIFIHIYIYICFYRENDKTKMFTDESQFSPILECKSKISRVIQEINDHRRDVRLTVRQPSLEYTTVQGTEVDVIKRKYIWASGFLCIIYDLMSTLCYCRPRRLSWMRCPTGDQEVAGLTPAEVGNILLWRLIMKYFLRSFSPFRWFKKGSCQFLAKECTILVNRLDDACPVNMWLGKLTALDMTPLDWLGHKTSTQTQTRCAVRLFKCL